MKKIISFLSVIGAIVAVFFLGHEASAGVLTAGAMVSLNGFNGMDDAAQIEAMAREFSMYDDSFDNNRLPLTKGVFKFKVTSTSTADEKFYLFSSYQLDAMGFSTSFGAGAQASRYGQIVEGAFRPIGSSSSTLTGVNQSSYGINEFLAYCKNVRGNKVTSLIISSSNSSVHSLNIEILQKDPINQLGNRIIDISSFRNPMAIDQTRTKINDGFALGTQDFIIMTIPAGVTDMIVELHMNGYQTF